MVRSSSPIDEAYLSRTRQSRELMEGAAKWLPGGSTRSFGWHRPYPIVIERGEGPRVRDADGNDYIDIVYNGLSLIHGHAYPPVVDAVSAAVRRGSGWLVGSRDLFAFAELLCKRLASVELVRFTNTGTEAAMLSMKVARRATGRPLILKARAGYHGSYDDLEAGLYGIDELPGRTLLADFGHAESFEKVLADRGNDIAAVVLEPLMFTGTVTVPPPGFLTRVQSAARRAGALFVLDDCLMLRLAVGGSAEKYGLDPDITFLGKFVGGGFPVGVVGGRRDVMKVLDPYGVEPLGHSGSFNGNLIGCVAGKIAMEHLTAERIAAMDHHAARLAAGLRDHAKRVGIPVAVSADGSIMGVFIAARDGSGARDLAASRSFHLAGLNHGVLMGPGGEIAMSTVLTDAEVDDVIASLGAAMADTAESIGSVAIAPAGKR